MFLLILESIGSSELILVAIVALIVFGPRKLPDLAKKFGKTMAEFRNATNEFKTTWEREAAFEGNELKKEANLMTDTVAAENSSIKDIAPISGNENFLEPKVRELSGEEAAKLFQNKDAVPKISQPETPTSPIAAKRDWL